MQGLKDPIGGDHMLYLYWICYMAVWWLLQRVVRNIGIEDRDNKAKSLDMVLRDSRFFEYIIL